MPSQEILPMRGDEPPALLIVDDDRDICLNLRDIFAELGYVADVAGDGVAALEMAQQRRYRVALVDYKMPGMDGAALLDRMRQVSPSTRPIMITAHAMQPEFDPIARDQPYPILPKPIDVRRLVPLVEKALNE
ncbi:MAG: response regulator [Planctomycetota bacterium]|nr:MAG: response regulator [Planctomycetota bacterium]